MVKATPLFPCGASCGWSNVPNAELIFFYHLLLFRIISLLFVAGPELRIGHSQIDSNPTPMQYPIPKTLVDHLCWVPGVFVRGQVLP